MGGRPKAHKTEYDNEDDVGQFGLNLSDAQTDEIARKLGLPDNQKSRLGKGTTSPPAEGEVMLTYQGRYVRIVYKKGQIAEITPPDFKYTNPR